MPNGAAFGRLSTNFIDAAEEKRFRSSRAPAELRDIRATLGLFIAINSSFAPLDLVLFDQDLTLLLMLRLLLVNGVLAILLALSFTPWGRRRFNLLAVAAVSFYIVFYAAFFAIGEAPAIFISGTAMLVLGVYMIAPLRYGVAIALGWSTTILSFALVFALDLMSLQLFIVLVGELVAINAVGMFALYRLGRLHRQDFHNLSQITAERSRYHDLLVRILPAGIAERMRGGEQHIADRYDEAGVLFVDIVGFTRMSAELEPEEIVTLLERIFAYFDELVDKHGLEKIKTIGDAYLVAAGLPEPRADYAEAIADFALDLQKTAHGLSGPDGNHVEIRIGFHCSPLIAGVIGESRFLYDMWGDTVNVASRMESLCAPGKIQASDAARDILADKFTFELRGSVEVKSRGDMQTWWLTGRR